MCWSYLQLLWNFLKFEESYFYIKWFINDYNYHFLRMWYDRNLLIKIKERAIKLLTITTKSCCLKRTWWMEYERMIRDSFLRVLYILFGSVMNWNIRKLLVKVGTTLRFAPLAQITNGEIVQKVFIFGQFPFWGCVGSVNLVNLRLTFQCNNNN